MIGSATYLYKIAREEGEPDNKVIVYDSLFLVLPVSQGEVSLSNIRQGR